MTNLRKRIAVFGLLVAVLMPALPATAANEPTKLAETVRTFVTEKMDGEHVPGMVFVMVDADETAIAEAFGLADLSSGREMTVDTPMRVGSISKPITAALGLELEAHDRIDLDVPVDTYLEVQLTDRYGPASTVRQLLQHRGGYPDAFVESHHLEAEDAQTLDEWVQNLADRSITPNVVASYSSVGYTLAGAGMAGSTGKRYPELAESALFGPLGMATATFTQPAPSDVAIGYSWNGNRFVPYPVDTPALVPGAGLIATGKDMARFMTALLAEDSPLSQSTRDGLLTPAGPYPGMRAYTTGLTEWRYEHRSALYHEGNGIGTTNRMTILPDEGVGFYTAVNGEALVGAGDPSPQTQFIRDLHEMLVEEFYPGSSRLDAVPRADGTGLMVDPQPGVYLPSRLDTGSVLRLEALVSQFHMDDDSDGMVFYKGPDGITYATNGGTGSYREAAWWETMSLNLAAIGGWFILALSGSVVAGRSARGTVRWLTLTTGGLVAVFVVTLGYGMATVDVMELFTGLTFPIRAAQFAIAGAIVAAAALLAVTLTRRLDLPTRVKAASTVVVLAVAALSAWSWIWQVLPI